MDANKRIKKGKQELLASVCGQQKILNFTSLWAGNLRRYFHYIAKTGTLSRPTFKAMIGLFNRPFSNLGYLTVLDVNLHTSPTT